MKATLIQPYYNNTWEPLGLGYIGAYVKANYEGDLAMDFYHGNFDSDEEIIKGCLDSDVIGFGCTSPTFAHGLRLARAIKAVNPKARTVFGAWHVTALKEKALVDGIDQIVVGEGEKAFLDILNGDDRQIIVAERVPFESIPFPDRDLIKNHRTVDLCETMNGYRTASFCSQRVCPVSCLYCSESIMSGKFNRKTNPIQSVGIQRVCDEIEQVVDKYKLTMFKFVDPTFDTTAQYVIDFCKEKIKRGIKTEWEALIHARFTTEEMMYWIKEANCNQINVGCETGSNRVHGLIGKGVNNDVIRKCFEWAKKYKINRRAFFILGMPNETRHDLFLTETLIDEISPDVVGFTILCPYPGNDLYNHEKYKDIDWEGTDEYSNSFWKTDNLSNIELHAYQAYFETKYKHLMCERRQSENV